MVDEDRRLLDAALKRFREEYYRKGSGEMPPRVYVIPLRPFGSNNAYSQQRRPPFMRFLTNEGRAWKEKFKESLDACDMIRGGKPVFIEGTKVKLTGVFAPMHEDFWYKNGNLKKKDLTNWTKLAEDCLAEYLGYDDSNNWDLVWYKRVAEDLESPYPFIFLQVEILQLKPVTPFVRREGGYQWSILNAWDAAGIPR
jgi:hypothetical protein